MQKKYYTKEFKEESLRLLETSGKSAREIEIDLGIGQGNLSRWKRESKEKDLKAFPGKGNPRDEELFQLRKELALVKEERDILRKAVAIFSKPMK
jgi:transposase